MPRASVGSSPARNTRIGGQPARLWDVSLPARAVRLVSSRIGAQRLILATLQPPAEAQAGGNLFRVAVCLRWPSFKVGETAVRQMLASTRFK